MLPKQQPQLLIYSSLLPLMILPSWSIFCYRFPLYNYNPFPYHLYVFFYGQIFAVLFFIFLLLSLYLCFGNNKTYKVCSYNTFISFVNTKFIIMEPRFSIFFFYNLLYPSNKLLYILNVWLIRSYIFKNILMSCYDIIGGLIENAIRK